MLVVLTLGAGASAALADGGGEPAEGCLLVQQALAHLAHDGTHVGIELAMEKVGDALEVEDQHGVAVAQLEQAILALEEEQVERARTLLQESIE